MAEESGIRRLYYTIGEVSLMTGIEQHVLRFWETEFTQLSPRKSKSGKRQYKSSDLEVVKTIQRLLYEEGYTIAGARRQLRSGNLNRGNAVSAQEFDIEELRRGLLEIKQILDT